MNKQLLWPMAIQILLTLLVFIPLGKRKKAAVDAGTADLSRTALDNSAWPDEVLKVSNNIQNQFQLPVLFYALCLRSVDLLRTNFGQQYIGNHIILNASDTILA
jgi:hypothetical protein